MKKKAVIAFVAAMGLVAVPASAAIPPNNHNFTWPSSGQDGELFTYDHSHQVGFSFIYGPEVSQNECPCEVGGSGGEHIWVSSTGTVKWSGLVLDNTDNVRVTIKGKFVTRHKFVFTYHFYNWPNHTMTAYDRGRA